MRKLYMVVTLVGVAIVLILIIGLCLWLPSASKSNNHVYPRAAVATDAKHCSEIGR